MRVRHKQEHDAFAKLSALADGLKPANNNRMYKAILNLQLDSLSRKDRPYILCHHIDQIDSAEVLARLRVWCAQQTRATSDLRVRSVLRHFARLAEEKQATLD